MRVEEAGIALGLKEARGGMLRGMAVAMSTGEAASNGKNERGQEAGGLGQAEAFRSNEAVWLDIVIECEPEGSDGVKGARQRVQETRAG